AGGVARRAAPAARAVDGDGRRRERALEARGAGKAARDALRRRAHGGGLRDEPRSRGDAGHARRGRTGRRMNSGRAAGDRGAPGAARRTIVKVCGLTRLEDAKWALECGADWLGFIVRAGGPRQLEPERVAEIVDALAAGANGGAWRAVAVMQGV